MCSVSLHFIGWQIYCNWGIKYCGNQIYLLGRPLAAKLQVLAIFEQKVAPCVEWYLRSSLRCSSVIIVLTRGHMPQIIITHSHHYMETCHMGGRRGARAANDPSVFTISWLKVEEPTSTFTYLNQPAHPLWPLCWHSNFTSTYHLLWINVCLA